MDIQKYLNNEKTMDKMKEVFLDEGTEVTIRWNPDFGWEVMSAWEVEPVSFGETPGEAMNEFVYAFTSEYHNLEKLLED